MVAHLINVKRSRWTAPRIQARDRRFAAIHEAGHVVIAQKFGFPCSASIWPDIDSREETWLENKTWLGNVRIQYPMTFGRDLTARRRRRMIAVAGGIAEAFWKCRNRGLDLDSCLHSDCWDLFGLNYELDFDVMSESDWSLSGCEPVYPDGPFFTAVRKVAVLLRPDGGALWPELIRIARGLIEDSRTRHPG